MTDRIKGFTVSLTHDMRDDDCKNIIDAIQMIKGVESVDSHIADTDSYFAKKQLKWELRQIIFDWFKKL